MKVLSEIREKRKGVEARYLVEKKSGGSEEEKVKLQLTSLSCLAAVNLHLLQNALSVVTGVELAVSRSAIPMQQPM